NFYKICELAVDYYKGMHHNDKECRRLMNQLIKYKARVKPWNLEYSFELTPFTWWDVVEDEHTDLQDLAKTIALNEMIFTEVDNLDSNKWREEENEMDIENLTANNIIITLQALVDLSDPTFGGNNNQGETQEEAVLTDEEPSIEFE
ncbi:7167_t:CDS:2, partial [Cetraspora pellucida]